MKCPACGNQLQEMNVEDIAVNACENGCGGIWFDNFELKKFDEPHEPAGALLQDIARDESITVDHTQRRKCPKCDDLIMMRHFFSVKQQVELDECPGCAGIWLDHGELETIRSLFESEQHKDQAAHEHFAQMFDEQLEQMKDPGKLGTILPNFLNFLT